MEYILAFSDGHFTFKADSILLLAPEQLMYYTRDIRINSSVSLQCCYKEKFRITSGKLTFTSPAGVNSLKKLHYSLAEVGACTPDKQGSVIMNIVRHIQNIKECVRT